MESGYLHSVYFRLFSVHRQHEAIKPVSCPLSTKDDIDGTRPGWLDAAGAKKYEIVSKSQTLKFKAEDEVTTH